MTKGNPSGNTPSNGLIQTFFRLEKRFTHTFATAGTVQYYCTLHPFMLVGVTFISQEEQSSVYKK
ncbi:MAG: hypothetical protein WA364_26590 [Candidatus Nitrosopolaris sp.]